MINKARNIIFDRAKSIDDKASAPHFWATLIIFDMGGAKTKPPNIRGIRFT